MWYTVLDFGREKGYQQENGKIQVNSIIFKINNNATMLFFLFFHKSTMIWEVINLGDTE